MPRIHKRVKRLLHYIMIESNYEAFEFLGAVTFVISGLVILNPWTDIYSNGVVYKVISQFLQEDTLGAIILFLGINAFLALINGNLRYRLYTAIVQSFVWGLLYTTFLTVNPTAWFPWFTFIFSLFSMIIAARIYRDLKANVLPWTLR